MQPHDQPQPWLDPATMQIVQLVVYAIGVPLGTLFTALAAWYSARAKRLSQENQTIAKAGAVKLDRVEEKADKAVVKAEVAADRADTAATKAGIASEKVDENTKVTATAAATLSDQINGRMDQLIDLVHAKGVAQGIVQGTAEQKAREKGDCP